MRFWWNPWGEWAIQGADGRRSTEDEAESLLASLHPIAGSLPACTASHWPQRPRSLRPATPLYAQSWVNTKRKEEGRVALKRVNRRGVVDREWREVLGMERSSPMLHSPATCVQRSRQVPDQRVFTSLFR